MIIWKIFIHRDLRDKSFQGTKLMQFMAELRDKLKREVRESKAIERREKETKSMEFSYLQL